MDDIDSIEGYAAEAETLIPRFEALDTAEILAPVMEILPSRPSRILEVGAGTGRDAAWLAERGQEVVAVEPVEAFRRAGMALHRTPNIVWIDDRLPRLERVATTGMRFDLILAIAVWQHLRSDQHQPAIAALAGLAPTRGRIILSVRHGPGSPTRPCFPADVDRILGWTERAGFSTILRRRAASVQQKNRAAGVTWTWLALERV